MGKPNEHWISSLRSDGVYVNSVHHGSDKLTSETANLSLRALEGERYHEAMKHIQLPRRKYTIKMRNGANWLVFKNQAGLEKDIEALGYGASVENTLEREIVSIIKGEKDEIFPEVDAVKTFRDVIIRVASDRSMRQGLDLLRADAKLVSERLEQVDEKRRKGKLTDLSVAWIDASEERSKKLFWDFMSLAQCNEEDLGAIHWLSWAWKMPATYGKLKHMAWCWLLIACVFGLIKSPNSYRK